MLSTNTAADIGKGLDFNHGSVDNAELVKVNAAIRGHLVEEIGEELRGHMHGMQAIV